MKEARDIIDAPPRKFQQERARKTYEALVQAATDVFADKGFDGAQTPDIAAGAGVSVGTFYRYFSDKREIFLELMRRHLEEGRDTVLAELRPERFVGKERRGAIEHTLTVLLDMVTRAPALQRVFLGMTLRDSDVARLHSRLEQSTIAQVARLIEVITSREQVPDPEATAWVIHASVVEASIRIAGFRGELTLSRERALAAVTQLCHRTLFGADPPDSD